MKWGRLSTIRKISHFVENPQKPFVSQEKRAFIDRRIWLALDRDTREIVGVHVGSRNVKGAKALWDSLPSVYRQCAVCYSDFWAAYGGIFPSKRHHAVGKETGQTNHVERLNNTFRQRISRLVRQTLSFSKKVENHIGSIWRFVHHDNASIHASTA